jgi:hypothetical protein
MCGNTSIPWQAFRNAIFCLRHKSKKKEFLGVKAVPFHERIEMVYQLSDDASPVPFGRLIRMTKYCKCSDPRDRVYGLLSMLQKTEREIGIKPDYSLTTGQVYQDMVLRFIHHFNTLKILASCEMQEKPLDMPTGFQIGLWGILLTLCGVRLPTHNHPRLQSTWAMEC